MFLKGDDELIKSMENILKKPTLNILNSQKESVFKIADELENNIDPETTKTVENQSQVCDFPAIKWPGRNRSGNNRANFIHLTEAQSCVFL